ncbi:hypothetical protein NQ314_010315 [Rhamnusium bicolor]|uniref:Uncharacterized protein n=1 Tax=Rhamnusium bicolor TaxID=1586634 RepID=A0AAV8XSR6_9CUCU|nr:hypothetical protein NQ314_010315 [Rhamnusium bicolor]
MILYFWRPKNKRVGKKSRKRRSPYSLAHEPEPNSVVRSERTSTKDNKKSCKRCLLFIVQNLIDKNIRTSTPPRTETVVSPRKRFLREMEKDKVQVEDNNCQKRSRSKPQSSQPIPNIPTSVVKVESPVLIGTSVVKVESPVLGNGIEDIKPPRNCSYSITSLLAEDRNIKRSPSNSPSHYSPVAQPQYCSPTSDDRWYSESVDRLRSIELTQVEKCGGYPPYPPQSYLGPYMYPFPPVPPYYGAGVYGRGYVVPSMYHTSPLQMPIRHETPSCSWTVEPTRDADHREETITGDRDVVVITEGA